MNLSQLPEAEFLRQLRYLCQLITGKEPDKVNMAVIAENLRKYQAFTDETDLKKAVEFALCGVTEVQGRQAFSVHFLGRCIGAYKAHQRQATNQPEEEYTGSQLTEQEKNVVIRQGLKDQIAKFDEDKQQWIPVFYFRWLVRMGLDPVEYCPHDMAWYIERAEHLDGTNKKPMFAENIYKLEVEIMPDTEAKRLVLWDFFRHVQKSEIDIIEFVKL